MLLKCGEVGAYRHTPRVHKFLLLDKIYVIEKEQSWRDEREAGEEGPLRRKSLLF